MKLKMKHTGMLPTMRPAMPSGSILNRDGKPMAILGMGMSKLMRVASTKPMRIFTNRLRVKTGWCTSSGAVTDMAMAMGMFCTRLKTTINFTLGFCFVLLLTTMVGNTV